ncbi:hypothetical protein [Sphingomonas sp. CFBP 8760]|uniref:hypothetical protein n=1 Tax=Sphingomonas sp. CFBP 8760 TaxID=2775282 RepID=UPI00177F1BC5|nr:hypothetical protein [Sphingomonas sp. CFBP 8760]MBD8546042.1 hypothetical protein [Sphingomonas sp. CFBP 8760]
MDMLRKEDGRDPFVLATPQIALLNRRASSCDHPLARLMTLATLIPCPAAALAGCGVRDFDRRNEVLTIASPRRGHTRAALGMAATAAVQEAIAGRTSGLLFGGAHDLPIAPDADAVAYLEELIAEDGEGPMPFAFTFRSVREGVFAGMADGGVPQQVAEAQAGLRHLTDGHRPETFFRVHERAASDWWAAQLGVPVPATIDVIRDGLRQLRWRDDPDRSPHDDGGAA